jgi:Coiled-coil domain-containing protein 124 /Oxs1
MQFEEERIAELRKEFPTLKLSQLKERIFKEVSNTIRP